MLYEEVSQELPRSPQLLMVYHESWFLMGGCPETFCVFDLKDAGYYCLSGMGNWKEKKMISPLHLEVAGSTELSFPNWKSQNRIVFVLAAYWVALNNNTSGLKINAN
jgi:hypothetical protein